MTLEALCVDVPVWSITGRHLTLSNFSEEIKFICQKHEKADYSKRFINGVIRQFQDRSNQSNIDDLDDYIIPSNFFDIPKSFILIELPFCETNEIKSKLSI